MDPQQQILALDSLKCELDRAYLPEALGGAEKDERLSEVYRRMAASVPGGSLAQAAAITFRVGRLIGVNLGG